MLWTILWFNVSGWKIGKDKRKKILPIFIFIRNISQDESLNKLIQNRVDTNSQIKAGPDYIATQIKSTFRPAHPCLHYKYQNPIQRDTAVYQARFNNKLPGSAQILTFDLENDFCRAKQ